MNYKDKYNKAVESIKRIYEQADSFGKELIEKKFPELRESEDERIRKALIHLISEQDGFLTAIDGISVKYILAWLEKQGGITKLNEEEQNKFAKGVLTGCAMSFINYLDAHKYEGKMCVSNGECEDIENAFHNGMWDRLHRYYCKYIEKQGKQEPISQCNTHEPTLDEARKWNEAYEKGYSLGYENGRNEQKPAEWSEEDEEMLERCIDKMSITAPNLWKKEIDWLKSLKSQKHWKPSEEQMKWLKDAIETVPMTCRQQIPLESLYNDLKKL